MQREVLWGDRRVLNVTRCWGVRGDSRATLRVEEVLHLQREAGTGIPSRGDRIAKVRRTGRAGPDCRTSRWSGCLGLGGHRGMRPWWARDRVQLGSKSSPWGQACGSVVECGLSMH